MPARSGIRMSAEERRADVVAHAAHAFARGGLHGTSTETIAAAAGISQPYLFRLFPTKVDLFLAAVERCFDQVAGAMAEAAEGLEGQGALDAMGDVYLRLLEEQPDLLGLQLHAYAAASTEAGAVRERVRARYLALYDDVRRHAGADAPVVEFFAMGMLCTVATAVTGGDLSNPSGPAPELLVALGRKQRP